MGVQLSFENLYEQHALRVWVTLFDTRGTQVTPTSMTYTLKDSRGEVINGREDESVTPETETSILISGDDLVPGTNDFIVKGTYDEEDQLGASFTGVASYFVKQLP